MSGEKNIESMIGTMMDKLVNMVSVNTVVGQPITAGDLTIIPISRVRMGFGAGGGDYAMKEQAAPAFGGGSGGAMSVQPMGFLACSNGNVRYIPVSGQDPLDKLVDMTPGLIDKIENAFKSGKSVQVAEAEPQTVVEVEVVPKAEDTAEGADE